MNRREWEKRNVSIKHRGSESEAKPEAEAVERGVMCDVCGGYNYELLGCCSGVECGCMGQPVDTRPCPKCNADGKKKASKQAMIDWPWFFLTEEEWSRHLEEKKNT